MSGKTCAVQKVFLLEWPLLLAGTVRTWQHAKEILRLKIQITEQVDWRAGIPEKAKAKSRWMAWPFAGKLLKLDERRKDGFTWTSMARTWGSSTNFIYSHNCRFNHNVRLIVTIEMNHSFKSGIGTKYYYLVSKSLWFPNVVMIPWNWNFS